MTEQEFAQKIKAKYPQYQNVDDSQLTQKVIQKYPQYQSQITPPDTRGPLEKTGIFNSNADQLVRGVKAVGSALTQSEQGLGKDIATGIGTPVYAKDVMKANEQMAQSDVDYIKQVKKNRDLAAVSGNASAVDRYDNALKNFHLSNGTKLTELFPALEKSNGQVVGDILGTTVDLLAAGSLKPITKAGKFAQTTEGALKAQQAFKAGTTGEKLATIAKDTLKTTAALAPIGYGYDVSSNLREGQTGAEAFKPGGATLFSTVIPLGIGGVRASKVIGGKVLPYVASNLSGVPEKAYEQLGKGQTADLVGKVTPEQVLSDARKSTEGFRRTLYDNFGTAKQDIIDQFANSRIGLNDAESKTFSKIADRFGFEQVPQNLKSMSANETMNLLEDINSVNPISRVDDPLVKNYKLALNELKGKIREQAAKSFGGEGGAFDKAYSEYSKGKKVLQDIQTIVGRIGRNAQGEINPTQLNTAQTRLMSIFNENRKGYYDAVKSLEDVTGEKILDKVAAAQFSPLLPKTLRGGPTGVIGLASDLLGLVTLPISSPRMGAKIISEISGFGQPLVSKLLNASPKIREGIYNAVVKENKPIDEAIFNASKELKALPNKQGGFVRVPGLADDFAAKDAALHEQNAQTAIKLRNEQLLKSDNKVLSNKELTDLSVPYEYKGKTIHPDDVAEMRDFTDFINGSYKPKNPIQAEIDARRIAEKLGLDPNVSNKILSNRFGNILDELNFGKR